MKRTVSRLRTAALGAALALTIGCLGVGSNFPSAAVTKIDKGVSTKKEIRRMFGEPFRTGVDNNYESWTYVYNRWTPFGKARSKDLYVVFNKDGTVRAYTYNSNLDDKTSSEGEGDDEE
ncbi:MAG: outer membrane protein assembly factor BamE domain-containing protein [Candidatus Binatia bacterium]